MNRADFDQLAAELALKLRGTDCRFFVAVFPPGAFEGKCGPHSAATLPAAVQVAALRSLADSIERGTDTHTITVSR